MSPLDHYLENHNFSIEGWKLDLKVLSIDLQTFHFEGLSKSLIHVANLEPAGKYRFELHRLLLMMNLYCT